MKFKVLHILSSEFYDKIKVKIEFLETEIHRNIILDKCIYILSHIIIQYKNVSIVIVQITP